MDVKVYIFTHDNSKNRRNKLNKTILLDDLNEDTIKRKINDDNIYHEVIKILYQELKNDNDYKSNDKNNVLYTSDGKPVMSKQEFDEFVDIAKSFENKTNENNNDKIIISNTVINKDNDIDQLSLYGNYIVDLFAYFYDYKNKLYGCPEIKIHKMLLILQISQALGKINFFDYYYQIQICTCGFKIPNLAVHTERFSNNEYKNIPIEYGFEQIYLHIANNGFFNNSLIKDANKKIIYFLFKNFADVSPYKLGILLDKIKLENIGPDYVGKCISSTEFNKLIISNSKNLEEDEILKPFFNDLKLLK